LALHLPESSLEPHRPLVVELEKLGHRERWEVHLLPEHGKPVLFRERGNKLDLCRPDGLDDFPSVRTALSCSPYKLVELLQQTVGAMERSAISKAPGGLSVE
jgi:hypothetical protein